MTTLNLVILGPAGSGKSTLTATFGRWLCDEMGFRVSYVNLDPGADRLPYKPDYDVRSIITVEEVMRREMLGPNGAIIRCMDILVERAKEVIEGISKLETDYRLIDTPGQMEPFTFRRTGPKLVSELLKTGSVISLFLVDPELASSVSDLLVVELMGLVVQLRLLAPTLIVLNKADKLEASLDVDKLLADPNYLMERLKIEVGGVISDLALSLWDALPQYLQSSRLVKVSAKTGEGLESLYDLIHEAFCVCGDLT